MVLVHKLRQMEQVDIQDFREGDEVEDNGQLSASGPETQKSLKKVSSAPAKRRPLSPPRRPITRSQTTSAPIRVSYRKIGAVDSDSDGPQQSSRPSTQFKQKSKDKAPQKKKAPPPTAHKRPIADVESEDESDGRNTVPRRSTSETSISFSIALRSHTTTPPPGTTSGTPSLPEAPVPTPDSSPTLDRRGSRSRASLPVPVPNLTKKSRGRRVPTKASLVDKDGTPKDTRLYVCKVEDCGKCFHRGEHLKRHIRSIHTHEKPFKCTHPACEKYFNRHDNLLQHLKVHKDLPLQPPSALTASTHANGSGSATRHHSSPEPVQEPSHRAPSTHMSFQPASFAPAVPGFTGGDHTIFSNIGFPSLRTDMHVSSVRSGVPEAVVSPLLRMAMAVSSLRTEMPVSPTQGTSVAAAAPQAPPSAQDGEQISIAPELQG